MDSQKTGVLVVDDEPSVTELLSATLEDDGYCCIKAATGEDALKTLPSADVRVVLLDLRLPGMSGMEVLRAIKSIQPETAVIIITGIEDAETAVEAMKTGAVDYIVKPFNLERVSHSIEAALHAATPLDNESAFQRWCDECVDEETDWLKRLDNIAEGVETRMDALTGHMMSKTVIEQTINAARCLEIPEDYIMKWMDGRRRNIERVKILDRLVEKRNEAIWRN